MATTKIQLTDTSWTSLGACPVFIENTSTVPAYYRVETADPGAASITDQPQHTLVSDGDDVSTANVTFSGQTVYARGRGTLIVSR